MSIYCRNIAGAMRVMAGKSSVQPSLAASLTARNHELDDMFVSKTLTMKEKMKKSDMEESDEEDKIELDEDGYKSIERIGVIVLI